MKKLVISGLLAAAALAFPGMHGGMHGHMSSAKVAKPMPGLTDNKVLAVVNGEKITVKDINVYLQGTTGDNRIRLQDLPAQHVKQFVDQYIDTLVLYKKAKSITKTPQFKAVMMKIADDMWLKQQFDNIKINDKEAKSFYEKNKDIFFKTTPKIKARHIVVKTKAEAEKLINELKGLKGKALENKFAELAKKYSIGPSKVNGGELGWFEAKEMAPNFAKAVTQMKAGELTKEPIHTRFGWHVILVEAKNSKNYIPYAKVKAQIIGYLKELKLKEKIKNIKNSAKVEYKFK